MGRNASIPVMNQSMKRTGAAIWALGVDGCRIVCSIEILYE